MGEFDAGAWDARAMGWRFDESLRVVTDAGHVTVHRSPSPGRPALLLTHGTGFCASTWIGVAEVLASAFDVYAIDRRGHGSSSAPDDAYDFTDFAADAMRVVDALGLRDAYAVGHSAGATDLLLCAAQRPDAFRKLFVMEPTAMHPDEPGVRAAMAPLHAEMLEVFARRRSVFESRTAVLEWYARRDAYADWRPDVVEAMVDGGYRELDDGSLELRCAPASETAMLRRIFAAMEGTYRVGEADHPFEALRRVRQPTRIVTTEHSQPIYREMAEVVRRLVPDTSHVHLDGLGHLAAQVDPPRVAAEILRFWDTDVRMAAHTDI